MSDSAQVQKPLFSSMRTALTPSQGAPVAQTGSVPSAPPTTLPSTPVKEDDDMALKLLNALPQEPSAAPEIVEPQPQLEPVTQIEVPPVNEFESFANAIPGMVQQATDTLNPQSAAGSAPASSAAPKESSAANGFTIEKPGVDVPGLQYVEQQDGAGPEFEQLPPEVEAYLTKAQTHDQIPHEIVMNDQSTIVTTPVVVPVKTPVIVLPITPEIEKAAERKPVTYSVKWLVEWSHKIIKMFRGKVVYRQALPT